MKKIKKHRPICDEPTEIQSPNTEDGAVPDSDDPDSLTLFIRKANMSDAQILADFNIRMAMETEGKQLDPQTSLRGAKAIFKDPHKGFYLVAEHNGTIIGQLMVTYEWSDWRNMFFYWIQSVFVREDYRKKGVFTCLYSYLTDFAQKKKNIAGLRLYVEKNNSAAKETYEKLGMYNSGYDMYELAL